MHSLTGAADFGVGAFAGLLAIGGADLLLGLLAGAAGAATAAAALGLAPGLGVWFAFGGRGRGRDRAQRRAMPAPPRDSAFDALPDRVSGAGSGPAAAPGAPRRDDGTEPSAADAVRKKAGGARPLALSAPGAWLSERLAGARALRPVGVEGRPAGGPSLPFRLEDGALMPLSRAARRFPGLGAQGVEVAAFARGVAVIEGPADLAAAFALLESDGLEFRAMVDDAEGETWELICAPRGGEARVDIAPAGPARRELARLRAELRATRAERDAAEAVLDAAPVMAWRRDAAGRVVWGNALYRRMSGAGEAQAETATGVRPGTGARPGAETSAGAEDARRTGRASAAPALPELRGDLGGPEPRADRADPDAPSRGASGSGSGSASGPDDRVAGRDGRAAVFDAGTGERRWFEISSRVGAQGEDLRFAVDAASAVHAEGALRRFVETLTETFAHIRIGLAIFDREQRLGLFNPAFAELMRLDPAWLAARPDLPSVLEQLRESRRLPDQDDFVQWRRGILGLFGSGDRTDADLRGPRPERTEIWHLPGEEQIRMVARPHPQGAVAFLFEDVTETARLERRFLTETETRRAVMDRLEEGVVTFGPDGVARFANPAFAAMWGFRPDADGDGLRLADAMARFRARSVGGEVWDQLQGFFGTAARSAWSDELTLTDGRRLRARVAALPDGSVLVAFLDVTDALRAEAAMRDRTSALEAAEEIRGALIEQVSLRMRTPLARVSGLTQRLRDGADERGGGGGGAGGSAEGPDAPLGPRQLALLEGVLEAAGQMQEALTGVSDLASAQAGVLAMTSEPVNLHAALASALDVARRRAQARGVALSLEADEALDASEEIQGDAQRLRQLLFNLVADAVHRAPRGGWVRAGARKLGDRVEVWTDEPAPEAALDGRSEPEAAVRGGLAHALVRRFAELHGGGVRVELVRRGAPAMSHEALEAEEIGPRGDRLHVVCSLPLAALRAVAPAISEPPRAERA